MRFAAVTAFALLIATLSSCSLLIPARSFDLYTTPQQRVAIGADRHIHMVCMGDGSPTVILSAGASGWSADWRLVQPKIARTTKVCAWDRAGHGFSSGSPDQQDIIHTEDDLERALAAVRLDGPLVMVAHSLGAFEALLFADRHPDRVAAMVLVDPSTPDQVEEYARAAPALMAWSAKSDEQSFDRIRSCIRAQRRAGESPPPDCASLHSYYPEPLRTNLLMAANEPMYWEAYLSLFGLRERNSKLAINEKRNYGAMPLIVLNAGLYSFSAAPAEAQREAPALRTVITAGHEAMARLSSRGVMETVPDSAHGIAVQKPQVVIEAIERAIDAARANATALHR